MAEPSPPSSSPSTATGSSSSSSSIQGAVYPSNGNDSENRWQQMEARLNRLEAALEREQTTSRALAADKARLQQACQAMQMRSEQDEEAISNTLLKRIRRLEAEKQALEARGSDTQHLQATLEQLRKEKVALEVRAVVWRVSVYPRVMYYVECVISE